MKKVGEFLKEFFVDGLSGMALGLFATLIIGTIVSQVGSWIPGTVGQYIHMIGKTATVLTGAGIGVGVAIKLQSPPLVTVSAAISGMVGGYASALLTVSSVDLVFAGPVEPLGAFLAAISAIYLGRLIADRTSFDIILTPLACTLTGSIVGFLLGSPISKLMEKIGELVVFGTEQTPLVMGIIVSVIMGMAETLPISSAALGVSLNLSGIAAGAATVGCCANMVGFAVASFEDNRWNGVLAQGIGSSKLQMSNIVKKPTIWIPSLLSSAIVGPLATLVFKFENNAAGSGIGTTGLIGPINAYKTMVANGKNSIWTLVMIILLCFVLPGAISYGTAWGMRKMNLIKPGDMKLDD